MFSNMIKVSHQQQNFQRPNIQRRNREPSFDPRQLQQKQLTGTLCIALCIYNRYTCKIIEKEAGLHTQNTITSTTTISISTYQQQNDEEDSTHQTGR